MGSGICRTAYGGIYATGAKIEIRGLGFTPKRVELIGEDYDSADWHEPMPADTYIARDPANAATVVATAGITPQADGFDIAIVLNVNVAGELVYWSASE